MEKQHQILFDRSVESQLPDFWFNAILISSNHSEFVPLIEVRYEGGNGAGSEENRI